ncbi:hypothetical protein HPB51_009373 [Rhipicephalus microplus]|uniref:Uncharacterized protein n=1 Tax=Rhipicephalus microplus TaxID=6941 RepID=A0A9J6F128_RHIMP|nr:hypothetical protein HPB51_009373 [Rhipicephalus microplus]
MTKNTKPKRKSKARPSRPAAAQAAATGNTSPTSPSTAKQLLEKQAVSATGGWLQQQAQETNSTFSHHVASAFSMTASSDNTPGVPALDTTEDMDTTAASRKRVREQNEELTVTPDLARNIVKTSQAFATTLPTDAEGDFITAVSRAAQRRASALQAAAVVTVHLLPVALFEGLYAWRSRRRLRPGVVAADAVAPECLRGLLAIAELYGIPVTARKLADRRVSIGFV